MSVEIPAPDNWREQLQGLTAHLTYCRYDGAPEQTGWYLDFVLADRLPRYFGPFMTEDLALAQAREFGMVIA